MRKLPPKRSGKQPRHRALLLLLRTLHRMMGEAIEELLKAEGEIDTWQ